MCFNLFFAAKRVSACVRLDLGAIQGYPFHGDQPFGAEHTHHLHKQVVERLLMSGTKSGQGPMRNRLQPT